MTIKQNIIFGWAIGSFAISCLAAANPTSAQIVPDATLPINSIVTPQGNTSVITGGTRAGGNLFHSFSQFSVNTGNIAYFNNAVDIQNAIARVTGRAISNINGIIKANGSTNLFLINPNGIIFGPNAQLNIGGSFLASTASSIKFADGSSFDATNPQAPPLLTINVPIGLQFGQNPGQILVRGGGNKLSFDRATGVIITDNRPVGLSVPLGETLALVGGDVVLEGGNITAPSGRIELGSVSSDSYVTLSGNSWTLGYEGVINFLDIRLFGAASADTSGSGGGNIQLSGRRVTLSDGSAILALTEGSNSGGTLSVRASESVELLGTTSDGQFLSSLVTEVQPEATGKGGNLTIETARLIVRDGGVVSAITSGAGDGGTLTVRASDSVELIGTSVAGEVASGLSADSFSTGDAGNLTIETARLIVRDGAQVSTGTFGAGDGGNLTVRASDSVELIGTSVDGEGSGLFASAEANSTGNAGNLTIETARLIVRNGAEVSTATSGAGDGRNLTVRASDSVELIGTSVDGQIGSSLSAAANSAGKGGNLTIETARLLVRDGALVNAATFGAGDGGTLTVRASDSVELIGTSVDGQIGSSLSAAANSTGKGGNLTIETARLLVRDGAQVNAATSGAGDGGTLTVRASDSVELIGTSADGRIYSGLSAAANSTGKGGNLTIDTARLLVRDGALVNAATFGAGDGGTITVRASDSVEMIGTSANGKIVSGLFASTQSASTGNAGNLTIDTARLIVRDGARVTVSSLGTGAAGNLEVNANSIRLDRQTSMRAQTNAGGGNITLNSSDIQLRRGSNITTNAKGTATGGNITLNTQTLAALENSDITANAELGFGGRAIVNARGIFGTDFRQRQSNATSDITASSELGAEFSGTVEINTPDVNPSSGLITLPSNPIDLSGLIASGCEAFAKGSSFTVTGKGGIPPSPHDPFTTSDAIAEWATLEGRGQKAEGRSEESPIPQSPIIEATGWAISPEGKVILTANTLQATSQNLWQPSASCSERR